MRSLLAGAVVVAFVGIVAVLVFVPMEEANENPLLILVGILGKGFSDVLSYYFGSSQGSAEKQDTLDRLAEGPTGNPGDPVHTEEGSPGYDPNDPQALRRLTHPRDTYDG